MEKKRMENKMQDSERNRKDFLMDMVKRVYSDDMNLIDLDRELVDKLDDFIASEISKAREEGRKELIKEIRESIKRNIKIDDTESKHIKIDTDIVKILNDKEITKMFLDGEEGEDIDWDCYGGWGWYS